MIKFWFDRYCIKGRLITIHKLPKGQSFSDCINDGMCIKAGCTNDKYRYLRSIVIPRLEEDLSNLIKQGEIKIGKVYFCVTHEAIIRSFRKAGFSVLLKIPCGREKTLVRPFRTWQCTKCFESNLSSKNGCQYREDCVVGSFTVGEAKTVSEHFILLKVPK